MKEYLSVKEYAAETGLSFQAVYKSIKAGKIPTEERTIDGKKIKVIVKGDNHTQPRPAVLDPVLLDDAAVIPGPADPALRRPSQRPPSSAGRRQDDGGPFPRLDPSSDGSAIDATDADPVLLDDAAVIPGPEDPAEDPDRQDDTAVTLGPEDPARNDGIKALEKAVEALTQQLAEKDRQIASLMQLLHDQQELQAHSQLLLSQPEPEKKTDPEIIETPPEPVKKTDPEIIETPPEPEKPKRRSFWAWLFE